MVGRSRRTGVHYKKPPDEQESIFLSFADTMSDSPFDLASARETHKVKCKPGHQPRFPYTKQEKTFHEPFMKEFWRLDHTRAKCSDVIAFKESFAEQYIKHFHLQTDLSYWREVSMTCMSNTLYTDYLQRATRMFSNAKQNTKADPPSAPANKTAVATISQFFNKQTQRNASGRSLYAIQNKHEIDLQYEAHKASTDGSKKGLYAKVCKTAYERLPEEVRERYEEQAKVLNADRIGSVPVDLSDDALQE